MPKTSRLLTALSKRPLAIRREMGDAVGAALTEHFDLEAIGAQLRAAGLTSLSTRSAGAIQAEVLILDKDKPTEHPVLLVGGSNRSLGGAVAVIPVYGMILHRVAWCGTSTQGLRNAIGQCLQDSQIGAILLEFDSPGGTVDNVPETADFIYTMKGRGSKPIGAIVNTEACSAAYWLAAQCDEILVAPSGLVGSIGVYMMHVDYSQANEKMGFAPTYIFFGEHKVDGNPDQPLSESARLTLQGQVNQTGQQFVAAVARGRNVPPATVLSKFGQGLTFLAADAVKLGLADEIRTLEEAVIMYQAKATGRKPGVGATRGQSSTRGAATRLAGVVPKDVSEKLAPKDTPWSKPTLADFTDKSWTDLSDDEKRHIAGHYAWAKENPPDTFGDLSLPHHRASDGAVVFKGVAAAAGRLDQASIPSSDIGAVKAHLRHHYAQFDEDPPDSIAATRADHTDVGRGEDGKFHAQCECDQMCACMGDGDDVCPPDCPTCLPDCPCVTASPAGYDDGDGTTDEDGDDYDDMATAMRMSLEHDKD